MAVRPRSPAKRVGLTGTIDTGARAKYGKPGKVQFNPDDITIVSVNADVPGTLDNLLPTVSLGPVTLPIGTPLVGTVSDAAINAAGRTSNVTINAKNSLTVNGLGDVGGPVAISIPTHSFTLLTGGTLAVHNGASVSAQSIAFNGGATGSGFDQPQGGVFINGALSANDVVLTGAGGGVSVSGSISGLTSVTHPDVTLVTTNAGPVVLGGSITAGKLTLNVAGSVTQLQPITVDVLTGSAGSIRLDTSGNNIAQLGSLQVQNTLDIAQAPALTIAGGRVTAGGGIFLSANNGMQIGNALAAGEIVATNGSPVELVSTGSITEPNGTITASALNAVSTNGSVQLGGANAIGTLQAGPVRGDQGLNDVAGGTFALTNTQGLTIAKEIGGLGGVTLTIAGDLTLGTPQSRGVLVAQGPINLNVSGDVTAPNGRISAANAMLGGTSRSLSLTGLSQIFGTLGNYTATNGIAITADGNLVLNGNIATPSLHLDVNGTIVRTSGSLAAGSLSGSAIHLADFGTNAQIGTLGAFSVTGSDFALSTNVPLTIAGPLSAEFIRIQASGLVTLTGTIATHGMPLALQSGVLPANPGSTIVVLPGSSGTGRFVEADSAAIVPLNASTGTLRIGVPGAGGQIAFGTLSAPRIFLVLDTGTGGRSSGTVIVDGLVVLGTEGGARLFGTVGGVGGVDASSLVRIHPRIDPAYTIDGCTIGASCISAQNLPQVYSVEYHALGSNDVPPLVLVAVPQVPAPLGWISSPDIVPLNVSGTDY